MMVPFYLCFTLVYTRNIYLARHIIERRNSGPEVFREKRVYRNLAKFTGKNLCQSLFFKNIADFRPATLLKKRLGTVVFL